MSTPGPPPPPAVVEGGAGAAAAKPVETIVVEAHADGPVRLNGEAIALERLSGAVEALTAGDNRRVISLRADRGLPVQRTIQVMDRIREAGSENIRFLTRPAEARP